MNISNPFKKKENEFRLNETELPSLSDTNQSKEQSSLPEIPPINDDMTNAQPLPGLSGEVSMGSPSESNPFSNVPSFPSSSQVSASESPMPESKSTNIHNEISRVKIESIDSKIALMEAKLSSIEQKLEIIYQMVKMEVSDETKQKITVDSMMSKIR